MNFTGQVRSNVNPDPEPSPSDDRNIYGTTTKSCKIENFNWQTCISSRVHDFYNELIRDPKKKLGTSINIVSLIAFESDLENWNYSDGFWHIMSHIYQKYKNDNLKPKEITADMIEDAVEKCCKPRFVVLHELLCIYKKQYEKLKQQWNERQLPAETMDSESTLDDSDALPNATTGSGKKKSVKKDRKNENDPLYSAIRKAQGKLKVVEKLYESMVETQSGRILVNSNVSTTPISITSSTSMATTWQYTSDDPSSSSIGYIDDTDLEDCFRSFTLQLDSLMDNTQIRNHLSKLKALVQLEVKKDHTDVKGSPNNSPCRVQDKSTRAPSIAPSPITNLFNALDCAGVHEADNNIEENLKNMDNSYGCKKRDDDTTSDSSSTTTKNTNVEVQSSTSTTTVVTTTDTIVNTNGSNSLISTPPGPDRLNVEQIVGHPQQTGNNHYGPVSPQNVRLMKEFRLQQARPFPNFTTFEIAPDNPFRWNGTWIPPQNSYYHGGRFSFSLDFPPNYPFKPPEIWFTTRIYHPYVDGSYVSIFLEKNWAPIKTLKSVLDSLECALNDPQFATEKFINEAKEWTQKYAMDDSNNEK